MPPPSPMTSRPIREWPTMPRTMRRRPQPRKSARSGGGLYEFPRRALGRTLHEEDRRDDRRAEVQGRAGAVGRSARGTWPKGDRRHAVPGCALSRCGRQGRHHLCRCLGRLCRRSRPLPAEGSRTSKARSASCALTTACTSPRPARASSRIMSSARSTRLLAARSAPIALPTEPATPDANAVPGQPAPRPLAGPILPLVASSVGTDQLLGGPGSRPAAVDALAARTLVKGEALAAPAGRADDFAWPRREIGREQAKGDTPVAVDIAERNGGGGARTEAAPASAAAAQRYNNRRSSRAASRRRSRPAQNNGPSLRDFFGGFGTPPRQPAPATSRRTAWTGQPRACRARRVTSDDRPKSRRAISRDV